jgi:hypothetical protein
MIIDNPNNEEKAIVLGDKFKLFNNLRIEVPTAFKNE